MSTRLAKVNALIVRELSHYIHETFEVPPGVLVTVTRVETSIDLKYATVYVSVLPDHLAPSTLRRLRTRLNALQRLINRRLNMRPVPRLRFVPDTSAKKIAHLDALLAHDRDDLTDRPESSPADQA